MEMQAKKPADKKPFKVLTRKAMLGWLIAIFVLCGWMFGLGVLVGRDSAPIEFETNPLGKKIAELKGKEAERKKEGGEEKPGAPKEKGDLEFYEALPENRDDTKLPKQQKSDSPALKAAPPGDEQKRSSAAEPERSPKPAPTPSPEKKPAGEEAASAGAGVYTVQAASVRNLPDAERLVKKLKQGGYPAYSVTSELAGKGTWHRVRVGRYAVKAEADRVLDKLRAEGFKPMLVLQK